MINNFFEIDYISDKRQRLDKYLSSGFDSIPLKDELKSALYSRSFIEHLVKNELITVNNKGVKKSYTLKKDDRIRIKLPERNATEIEPENIPLDIIYEDKYLAVVNKPANMIVHPAGTNNTRTLVNALIYKFGDNLSKVNEVNRPGIVHRLDKDTTGLIVVAKDNNTHILLQNIFRERKIRKYYKAITLGVPFPYEDRIHTYINRSPSDRKKMTVDVDGKEALTMYRVIHSYDYFALIDIRIETGRTHQIRTHFSYLNHPIFGDQVYSSQKAAINSVPNHYRNLVKMHLSNSLSRQALHAYKLIFEHPVKNQLLFLEADLPNDFKTTLKWLETHFHKKNINYP